MIPGSTFFGGMNKSGIFVNPVLSSILAKLMLHPKGRRILSTKISGFVIVYPFSLPAAVLLAGGAPTAVFNALVNPGEQRTSTAAKA